MLVLCAAGQSSMDAAALPLELSEGEYRPQRMEQESQAEHSGVNG